jgi:hypothetical protein
MPVNRGNTGEKHYFKANISPWAKIKSTYSSFHSHYLQNGEVVFKKIK